MAENKAAACFIPLPSAQDPPQTSANSAAWRSDWQWIVPRQETAPSPYVYASRTSLGHGSHASCEAWSVSDRGSPLASWVQRAKPLAEAQHLLGWEGA